jgi:membrane protein DedA with SNARE-associated domain
VVVLLTGPLLWVAALVVVAYVLRHREAVEIALAVVAVSFLVAIVLLAAMRARRVREEESA